MCRGVENLPIVVAGLTLPPSTRLQLQRTTQTVRAGTLVKWGQVEGKAGLLRQLNLVVNSTNYRYQEGCVSAVIDGSNTVWLSSGLEVLDYLNLMFLQYFLHFFRGVILLPVPQPYCWLIWLCRIIFLVHTFTRCQLNISREYLCLFVVILLLQWLPADLRRHKCWLSSLQILRI